MSQRPTLFVVGANYEKTPIELRERFFMPEERLSELLPQVQSKLGLKELAALSTCNRFELFGIAFDGESAPALARHAFKTMQGVDEADDRFEPSLYIYTRDDALLHLFRVCASLDSLVLGETQITGQFKDALQLASSVGCLGPILHRLGQDALSTAKKVRNQTAIGRKHVSISHAGVDLAKKVFGDLSQHAFLILGAGEMARVAMQYVHSYKPKGLYCVNRTLARAEEIVSEIGRGEALSLDQLEEALGRVDVVIATTSAPGFVIDVGMVAKAQAKRREKPFVILDMALPRDVDPKVGELDEVYLFDIDDLNQVVTANREERREAAESARAIIEQGIQGYKNWYRNLAVSPALSQFRGYLDDVCMRESQKSLDRDLFRELTPKQREALQDMVSAIAGRIAGDAARKLTSGDEVGRSELAEALSLIFLNKS